jgi:aryl-alcohol dehydrogenase-like predicted oxidoreductase
MGHEHTAAAAGTLELAEDMVVCRLGFGARWVTMHGADAGRALSRRAVQLGITFIDTADVYGGDNASERLIAEALHPYPPDLVIATKGGQRSVGGQPVPDCRPEYLRQACERSLRALRVDTIDLYQLHNPDPEVPLAESLGALVQMRDEGKIRHIGVSNVFRELLDLALSEAPIVSVQNQYNVDTRFSDPEVDLCATRGIAFIPWTPILMGDLARAKTLERVAAARDATPAQVAIAWLLAQPAVTAPIASATSLAQLRELMASVEVTLDAAALQALEQASA